MLIASCSLLFAQDITGTGTAEDPYTLFNAADFDSIRYLGNSNDYYYRLVADIDFASWGVFEPLFSNGFNLNGGGYSIKNVSLKQQICTGLIDSMVIAENDTVRITDLILNRIILFQDSTLIATQGQWSGAASLVGFINGQDHDSNMVYFSRIEAKNITISNTVYNYAACVAGIIAGHINNLNHVYFYQAKIDSSFALTISTHAVASSYAYSGGLWGSFDNASGIKAGSINAYECGISNSIIYAYDWDDFSSAGGLGGYYFHNAQTPLLAKDLYFYNTEIGGTDSFQKRVGALFSSSINNQNAPKDSIANYIIANEKPIAGVGTLTGSNSSGRAFVGYTYSATTAQYYNGYVDTTNLFRCDPTVSRYFDRTSSYVQAPNIRDTSDLRLSGTFTGFNFVDTWTIDPTILNGFPSLRWQLTEPTSISIVAPLSSYAYFAGDTIPIIATTTNVDTAILYYSLNDGLLYSVVDTIYAVNDTLTGYYFAATAIEQIKFKIQCFNRFNNPADSSVNITVYPAEAIINILTPTETSQEASQGLLLVAVETRFTDRFGLAYSYDEENYLVLDNAIDVDPGDGFAPDTTNINIPISSFDFTRQITLKAYTDGDSIFTYNDTIPLYSSAGYTHLGKRSSAAFSQGVLEWSDFYIYADTLYTVSFFGYVWGWYDYADRIDFYKYDPISNYFIRTNYLATPGAAYYPYIDVYRSEINRLTMASTLGSSSVYKHADITLPTTASAWGTSTSGTPPTSIDVGHTSIVSDGWNYVLNTSTRQITASDLNNFGNSVFVADASSKLPSGNIDFMVFNNRLMVSARTGRLSDVWQVGASLTENAVGIVSDTVTFLLQGQTRNYFRGIYPNAIIEYFPPIR